MSKHLSLKDDARSFLVNILSNAVWQGVLAVLGIIGPSVLVAYLARNVAWVVASLFMMGCVVLILVARNWRNRLHSLQHLIAGLAYVPVELAQGSLNWVWDHPDLPKGKIWLRGVLFDIKSDKNGRLVGLMVTPTESNELGSVTVPVGTKDVECVCILLNTAFGLRINPIDNLEWEGRPIGAIRLTYQDGTTHETPLILGHNIRDWAPGNQPYAVFRLTDPSVVEVWTSSDGNAAFDMLCIRIAGAPATVARISVVAQMGGPSSMQPAVLGHLQAVQHAGACESPPSIAVQPLERSFPQIHVLAMTCQVKAVK